jgi:hypothetical protein
MEVAHAYLPVGDHVVGGDWHDIVPLPGGRAALIVGEMVTEPQWCGSTGRIAPVLPHQPVPPHPPHNSITGDKHHSTLAYHGAHRYHPGTRPPRRSGRRARVDQLKAAGQAQTVIPLSVMAH